MMPIAGALSTCRTEPGALARSMFFPTSRRAMSHNVAEAMTWIRA